MNAAVIAVPERIGKYPVLQELGRGATSVVYLCNDPFYSRNVAVKVVMPEAFQDKDKGRLYRKLFVTEASLAGKLQHPHICQIYDAVADDRQQYIVMEYVDGGTLERHGDAQDLLPIDRVVEIIFKCTRALEFAHKMGITHRDLKPANILYSGETDVKVSDFGAALIASGDITQVCMNYGQHGMDHGHFDTLGLTLFSQGDEVLRETVQLLRSTIRRGDHVFRIGGDEFVVIFSDPDGPRNPGTSPPDSVDQIVRRFQSQVFRMRLPKLGLDAPGTVTVSAGLATYPWDGLDAKSLLSHADQLALQSKRSGKNLITFGPGAREHLEGK